MSYYANIDVALKIKKNQENELLNKISTTEGIDWDYIFDGDSPEIQDLIDSEENHIKILCDSFYGNYHEDMWYDFLKLIAPYIEDGEEIECEGEGGDHWAFVKENGKWHEAEVKYEIDKTRMTEI